MAEHIVPKKTYYLVFTMLMILTATTTAVAYVDLGWFNGVAAMTIAVIKATLVVLFFMHVKYSMRLTWVAVASGVFWLGIMIMLTMSDYLSRGWLQAAIPQAN